MCAKQIKRTWLRIRGASTCTWYSMLLLGGGGFGGGSQKSPRRGLLRWPGCWRGDFCRFETEGGEISAAAVRVGCQRRRAEVFRVVLCGVGRRHGGGNPMVAVVWTSGGLG